jgi:hypothetical protein
MLSLTYFSIWYQSSRWICFELSAVFELAKKDVYCVFTKQGDVNIEKVKRSKYFQALHQNFSQNAADPLV